MKKLVLLAVGAILLLGVVAVAAVLLASGGDDVPTQPAPATPAPVQPSGPVAPVLPPTPVPPPPRAPVDAGYPPGPRKLELPRGRVLQALSEPLAGCFRSHPPHASLPGILTLELEAQASGGYAVTGSRVKAWGGATRELVDCAQSTLVGRVVPGTTLTPGERALYDLSLEPPPSIAPPPPPEPAPSTLPTNRRQPQRRGATTR